MIRAVLFDWGDTLLAWRFDPELFVEGHTRGLAALGPGVPSRAAFTEAYSEQLLPLLLAEREDELDYRAELGRLLMRLGYAPDAVAVDRFVTAEQQVWRPSHRLDPAVWALLDGLRERGLAVGVVSNLFDPASSVLATFQEIGLLERLDAVALSADVGKRKPHPSIFRSALGQLGVAPAECVMVGDRLREDVGGAKKLGLAAIQATWYARDDSGAAEPDAIASEPADVLAWLDAAAVTT